MKNRVLIVDDEKKICEMLGGYLKSLDYEVFEAYDGEGAIAAFMENKPDVVILDIRMPGKSGIEALEEIKNIKPETEVIMATAVTDINVAIECMKKGAIGFQLKPIDLDHLTLDVMRACEHKKLVEENIEYKKSLEAKVAERTREVTELNAKLKVSFIESVRILMSLVEIYDPFLGGHSKRLAFWGGKIGEKLNLSTKQISDLQIAALLHDIGTVALPEKIKNAKLSDLSPTEITLIHKHTEYAQNIMAPSPEFAAPGRIIRHHLEKLDGSGFPDGLAGTSIPFESRVLGVLNAYDEMISRRRFSNEPLFSKESEKKYAFKKLYKSAAQYYELPIIQALEAAVTEEEAKKLKKYRVSVAKLAPNMRIADNIYSVDGKLLLAKGNTLNAIQIEKLQNINSMDLLNHDILVYKV